MMTHTQRCLNIKLVCKICKKEYESSEGIENHIGEMHKGYNDPLFLLGLKYCLSKVHFYYVIFNTSYVYNHVYLKIKTSISYDL